MLPYLRFELELRCHGPQPGVGRRPFPGDGPALTGPRLRRVLGAALVKRFCPFGTPRCEAKTTPRRLPKALCGLAETCPYGVMVAASRHRRPPLGIYVPPIPMGAKEATVELTLLGSSWNLYGWVLRLAAGALWQGLGKERQRWRVSAVSRVAASQIAVNNARHRLCDDDLEKLPADLQPDVLPDLFSEDLALPPRPVTLELMSPTRLLSDGRLVRRGEVPFDVLIGRIIDRYGDLCTGKGEPVIPADWRQDRLRAAREVPLLRDDSRWVEVADYSARHGGEMRLGGKVGRVTYGPEATRFLPILRLGEWLQVGKNVASGCGRLRIASQHRPLPVANRSYPSWMAPSIVVPEVSPALGHAG